MVIDKPNTPDWRSMETAPKDRCVKVRVRGWREWTYATFDQGAWRDVDYSPIDAIGWTAGDHLGRTDKDFAIEFGGYLATAAERYMRVANNEHADHDTVSDAHRALESAIHEFRKRAGTLK